MSGPHSAAAASSAAGPSSPAPPSRSKRALSPASQQAAHLAKLMANPSKPVHIPAPPKEKELRAPREMMKNVTGSSAGAGSGEFHVYKHARRREYERIKLMEEKAEKEKEQVVFSEAQKAAAAASEAKTSKNRSRRDKKKEAKRRAAAEASASGAGSEEKSSRADGDDAAGERAAKRIRIGQAPLPPPAAGGEGPTQEDADEAERGDASAGTPAGGIKFRRRADSEDDDVDD